MMKKELMMYLEAIKIIASFIAKVAAVAAFGYLMAECSGIVPGFVFK